MRLFKARKSADIHNLPSSTVIGLTLSESKDSDVLTPTYVSIDHQFANNNTNNNVTTIRLNANPDETKSQNDLILRDHHSNTSSSSMRNNIHHTHVLVGQIANQNHNNNNISSAVNHNNQNHNGSQYASIDGGSGNFITHGGNTIKRLLENHCHSQPPQQQQHQHSLDQQPQQPLLSNQKQQVVQHNNINSRPNSFPHSIDSYATANFCSPLIGRNGEYFAPLMYMLFAILIIYVKNTLD